MTFRLLCDFSYIFRRHKLFPTANASQSTASAHPQVRPVRLWMLVALIGGGIPVGPHNTHLSTKNLWISVSTKIINLLKSNKYEQKLGQIDLGTHCSRAHPTGFGPVCLVTDPRDRAPLKMRLLFADNFFRVDKN